MSSTSLFPLMPNETTELTPYRLQVKYPIRSYSYSNLPYPTVYMFAFILTYLLTYLPINPTLVHRFFHSHTMKLSSLGTIVTTCIVQQNKSLFYEVRVHLNVWVFTYILVKFHVTFVLKGIHRQPIEIMKNGNLL